MATRLCNRQQTLAELIVKDDLDELNAALARANIEPGDVVTILPVPRITPAIGDYEAKLRVIYRTQKAA